MDDWKDEVKLVKCDMCGRDVPCNVAYPVSQITCVRCILEKKWLDKERSLKNDKNV